MSGNSKSKKHFLIKTMIGTFLAVSAASYIFSNFQQYMTYDYDTVIRLVEDQKITASRITKERDILAQKLGSIPQNSIIRTQLIQQALDNATMQAVITSYAKSQGVRASETEIANALQSIQAFAGADGKFDALTFKRVLQYQRVSIKDFKNNIGNGIIQANYTTPVLAEFPLSDKTTKIFNDFAFTKINFTAYQIDYKTLPQSIKAITPPTQDQLQQIYTEKKSSLKRPALKDIEYVLFDSDNLSDKIKITDTEISDFYTKNQKELYHVPEKRNILQILIDDEKKANTVYATLSKANNFQSEAKKLGYALTDIDLGTITADEINDVSSRDIVFSNKQGDITKPIKTDFGYAIYFTKAIQPATTQAFDTVKSDIKTILFKKKLTSYLSDISPKIDDDLAGGADFSEIVQQYGSQVVTEKNIMPNGILYDTADGRRVNPLIPINDIRDYDVGDDIPMITLSDGQFAILKVTNAQPERTLTFDEAKQVLYEQDINTQKNTILTKIIKSLKEENNKQELVKRYHITTKEYEIDRNGQVPQSIYHDDFSDIVFATKPDQNFSVIEADKAIMLSVNSVTPPTKIDITESSDLAMALQKNYDSIIQDEALNMIKNKVVIKDNPEELSDFLNREIGE